MPYSADRVSGVFFLLFGLAMFFLVVPNYVETVTGSNLAPKTLPNAISIVIAFGGAILAIKPTNYQTQSLRGFVVTGAYSLLLAVSIYAMSWFGFEYIAPVLALSMMWMIGERRPLWLGIGTVVVPLLIWFLVTYALGRALP